MKEFLSAREVDYVSVNVLEDAAGLERLAQAGIRGVPVVARGNRFLPGVDLSQVAALVGLPYDGTPLLPAEVLVGRCERVLDAAIRFASQIPVERLGDELPNRDRTYLALVNHLVQITVDYVEVAHGADFTEARAGSVPDVDLELDALSEKSRRARHALRAWLRDSNAADLQRTVVTYFGDQSLHQVLERCVWHSAQHARQLMMVLERLGVTARDPLTAEDFRGLPMPEGVWDG